MIDATWIDHWAEDYDKGYDTKLNEIGQRVRKRGYYDREGLLYVGGWKARHRTQSRLNANSDKEIRDITSMALEAELPYQHRILTLLKGVAVPTASALLMVWDQDRHTVIDVNAISALHKHGEISTQRTPLTWTICLCVRRSANAVTAA
jgi:hypothetical protein